MSEPGSQTEMEIDSIAVDTQPSQINQNAVAVTASSSQGLVVEQDVVELDSNEDGAGRKEIASRSKMWDHFIKIRDDKKIVRSAKCKYCSRILKADSKSNGTSSLKKHFNVCKRNPHKFAKDPTQGTLQATQGEGVVTWRFDQDELRAAFAEMVIEDEQPFCFGEKPGLRKFMAKACPRFQLPSRRTCTRDVQLDSYITVTTSFIDDSWRLHKKVIGFFMVKGHKGDDIGKNVMRCMSEWGLDRVMTITVDNASANDTAHIINLIVQDGLKEVDVSVKRVRAAVRWNSTYLMLKAALVYEKVFIRFAEEDMSYVIDLSESRDGVGHPDETDCTDVLQSAMGRRMKDKFDKYWGIWNNNRNGNMNSSRNGKEKEKENFNLLMFVAGCLDPRYKLSMYTKITVEEIFGEERGQLVWEAINTCVRDLFEEYRRMYSPSEEATNVTDPIASKGGRGGKLKEVVAKRMKLGNGSSNNTKSELDKYLAEETEDMKMKLDLLLWWKAS
ncbi:zinc finger BED domain-containing protein RICESLEEPER 2-like [Panicum hallii]|uniref:zinc finger BED domain-containing protein RICESLEEPER 2-like n=1 Tax=Panicum hallii TaxID=206008 RepID=UPI000DF4D035|nr:zinc finger BED domain-containing protein RICESLEEPER 2-like [Panicum hallii]